MRQRPAPRAVRSASSRRRRSARASSRFATLAQAISSRKPVAATSRASAGRTGATTSSTNDTANGRNCIAGEYRPARVERLAECEELRGCLRGGHAGRELRGRVVAMIAALVRIDFEHERRPELGGLGEVLAEVGRQLEAFRHDADDLVAGAVDLHRATEHALIAAEPSLPEAVAEDHHARAGAGRVFSALEAATVQRAGAENLERICGHVVRCRRAPAGRHRSG